MSVYHPEKLWEIWQSANSDPDVLKKLEADGFRFNFKEKAIEFSKGWIYFGDSFREDLFEVERLRGAYLQFPDPGTGELRPAFPEIDRDPSLPGLKDMEALLSYLPKFTVPDFKATLPYIPTKKEIKDMEAGIIHLNGSDYHPDVYAFFMEHVSNKTWMNYDYSMEETGKNIRSPDFIKVATLSDIKDLFTYCIRSERFCDGSWGSIIDGGIAGDILRRLKEIYNEAKKKKLS
jgi:hypothetical protein